MKNDTSILIKNKNDTSILIEHNTGLNHVNCGKKNKASLKTFKRFFGNILHSTGERKYLYNISDHRMTGCLQHLMQNTENTTPTPTTERESLENNFQKETFQL